jgi:hypothetical protein
VHIPTWQVSGRLKTAHCCCEVHLQAVAFLTWVHVCVVKTHLSAVHGSLSMQFAFVVQHPDIVVCWQVCELEQHASAVQGFESSH